MWYSPRTVTVAPAQMGLALLYGMTWHWYCPLSSRVTLTISRLWTPALGSPSTRNRARGVMSRSKPAHSGKAHTVKGRNSQVITVLGNEGVHIGPSRVHRYKMGISLPRHRGNTRNTIGNTSLGSWVTSDHSHQK